MPDIFSYYRPYDKKNYLSSKPSNAEIREAERKKDERIKKIDKFLDLFTIRSKSNQQTNQIDSANRKLYPNNNTYWDSLHASLGEPTQVDHMDLLRTNRLELPRDETLLTTTSRNLNPPQRVVTQPIVKNTTSVVVPMKKGETVASMWTRVTGLPWKAAKEMGLSDGSYASNIEILKGLKSGEITKESLLARIEAENAVPYEPAPAPIQVQPAEPVIQDRYVLPPDVFGPADMTPPTDRENNMAAFGGFYW